MDDVIDLLRAMESGNKKTIKGVKVTSSDSNNFIIDDKEFTIDEALDQIEQRAKSGPDYKNQAYILVDQKGKRREIKRIKNKTEHAELIARAKAKKLYVYYTDVIQNDGKYYLSPILLVDWESVPDYPYGHKEPVVAVKNVVPTCSPQKIEPELVPDNNIIKCPYCNKTMTSTPGRTLHVKSKHPEKYQEYIDG